MSILRGVKALVSFFTTIPVGGEENTLDGAANYMPFAPLVGVLIGLLAGLLSLAMSRIFPSLLVGMLTLAFILLITGVHHTDGLLDLGDGLMCQGPPAKKIQAMHDGNTGAGGLVLGVVTLAITAITISYLTNARLLQSLIAAEVSSKLGMVTLAWMGRSAHQGMNTSFIDAMHGRQRILRLMTAFLISFGVTVPLLGLAAVAPLIIGSFTAVVLLWISNRHFGGVTGDVFGATNDISRMMALLAILVL
ncbi:MAG: adenosylcobinamide-GDP ribazoletransferase [Thaumarchaeota archaeon]|nr:adenosylcobinamide-GDP ribazoletransferase [Nitrososphaerota archaeon]